MANAVTVGAILYAATLELLDCLSNIRGNSAELGVRHKTTRTENLTQTTNLSHLIGSSNCSIKVNVASLDFSNEIIGAYNVSTGFLCCTCCVTLGKYCYANSFARTIGEANGTTELLVSLTGVDAKTEMSLYRFIKVSSSDFLYESNSLERSIGLASFDLCSCFLVLLRKCHLKIPFVVLTNRASSGSSTQCQIWQLDKMLIQRIRPGEEPGDDE